MREELLSIKEPGLDGLGNSQPLQVIKDTKLSGKHALERKPRVARQLFANTWKRSKARVFEWLPRDQAC